MADSVTQANNKAVRFRGQADKEYTAMPLKKGKSKKVVGENIAEFHTGKTYAHTKKKFGKARADKQAVAVAMSEARKFGNKAGHNPPKPTHATKESRQATKHHAGHEHELIHHANHSHKETTVAGVPRHLRGRGLISEKAMAIMGKRLAGEAQEPSGPHVARAAKSHHTKGDAAAAKPWKGQKLPGWARGESGKQDAERAHSDD
jgi:hypothetical protein